MIELNQVTMKFDEEEAVSTVNLLVKKGSAFGLLGANGAGKSTILRLLSGVYKPTSGEVKIEGQAVFDNVEVKKKVFFINDETIAYNQYTVSELRNYYKLFYPDFSEEIFLRLVETIKLPLNKKISKFSKGMKRQAIMVVAIACRPEYLLLDEAFDGLDPTMRIIVKRMLIDAMVEQELTVVISSHNLKEIEELCDTIAFMYQGKIVLTKELDELNSNIHKIQVAFGSSVGQEKFSGLDLLHFNQRGSIASLIVRGNYEEIEAKIDAMNPLVFDRIPLSLDEIFVYEMEGVGYEYDKE